MSTKQPKKDFKQLRTNKHIPQYNSISQFLKAIGRAHQHESDFTIDTLENYFNGKLIQSGVYRANYFVFVYITDGKGTLMLDNEVYDVGRSTFYYVNPGHLIAIQVDKSLKGYMMSTNEKFFPQRVHRRAIDRTHENHQPVVFLDHRFLSYSAPRLSSQQVHETYRKNCRSHEHG